MILVDCIYACFSFLVGCYFDNFFFSSIHNI